MKKLIVFVLAICFCLTCFSQEKTITFMNHLKTSSLSITDAIPIVNNDTDEISLFFADSKQVYGYLFNSDFKITKELVSNKRSRKYKTVIGSRISEDNYILYLTNNKRDKFATVRFSYENDNSEITEIPLVLEDEKFIQTLEHDNKFHLLTVDNRSSILNVYVFNDELNYEKKKVDLSQDFDKKNSLYDLLTKLTKGNGFRKEVDINKIEESNPNSIEVASEETKLYKRGSEIIFSFDENQEFTKIVVLNLDSFEYEVVEFDKPFIDIENKSTNSFINGNQIYIVASTMRRFKFAVYDFKTGNLLRDYKFTADQEIPFKNTTIIQVGGQFKKYRELEKTQKFLRKVTYGNIGVSVFKHKDRFQISFGGKQEIRSGGVMVGAGGFSTPMMAAGGVTVYYNPTFYAYNSYSSSKSIYFKGIFDANFNHLEGEIEKNAFDKIKDFEKENNKIQTGKSVFRYKNYYILGNFSRKPIREYKLKIFKD